MKDIIFEKRNRFVWGLLAFQGGFVNIGGFLSVHVFVSHLTGFPGHFSVELLNQNYVHALYFLFVPVFFLFGSFFTGVFTEVKRERGRAPVYVNVLLLQCLLYLTVALLGYFDSIGDFAREMSNFKNFILLIILAFSCGSQNSLFTKYSNSILRTTHITGLVTDLGIGLSKVYVAGDQSEKEMNSIRSFLILFFGLGSFIGLLVFNQFQFLGFLVPVVVSLFVGVRLYLCRVRSS